MATYRGVPVHSVEYLASKDVYEVRGTDGSLLAELSRGAFFSLPQLRMVPHGRHRSPASKAQGYPTQARSSAYARAKSVLYSPAYFTWDEPEPPAVTDAGIRAGEITALRAWRVRGGRLFSVYIEGHEWFPGQPASGDVNGNSRGVHAFRGLQDVHSYLAMKRMEEQWIHRVTDVFYDLPSQQERQGYVIGTIELWGNVIEHERGYRAEFGQIASLDRAIGDGVDLDKLRQVYQVGASPTHDESVGP